MNPYEPSKSFDHNSPRPNTYLWCFACVAYLTYVTLMMINRGPSTVLASLLEFPIGAVIEALIILFVSGIAGWIGALGLDPQLAKIWLAASRFLGGVAFGLAFITCQPYVFPYTDYILRPLMNSPLERLARWCVTQLSEQPYVLIPTILFAAFAAWTAERLFRIFCPRQKPTNQALRPSSGSRSTLHRYSTPGIGWMPSLPD